MRKYMDSNVVYETKDMSKEKWIERRKEGIGGSDATSVLGLNPYRSSISVYMEKFDYVHGEDKMKTTEPSEDKKESEEVNYRMELGNKLEDFVASEFSLKTGKKVRNVNGILKNDKYPFALANIDRAVLGEKAFLECKVTNSYSKKLWQKEVPMNYQIQCFHYMAVTGATHCYIAALIGNEELVIHKLDRDEELVNQIMDLEKMFWDKCVLGGELPTPDGSDDYSKILQGLYKDTKEEELILFEKEDLLNRYDQVSELVKDLDSEKKAIEQYLQLQMKEYEIAYLGDRRITWKKQTRSTLDSKRLKKEHPELAEKYMKTTTSRVFRI
ncbi:MAG: YqaJ viral recombinase family protein [Romboutsia sp.]